MRSNKQAGGFRRGDCFPMVGIGHNLMEVAAFSILLDEPIFFLFGLFLKRRLLTVMTNTQCDENK